MAVKKMSFEEERVEVLLKRDIYSYQDFLIKWCKKNKVDSNYKIRYLLAKPLMKRYMLEQDIINDKNIALYERSWAQRWINEHTKELGL